MTERLADLSAQIDNVRQLETIVTAMRGIAGARAQQARALHKGVVAFADAVAQAIGTALSLCAADSRRDLQSNASANTRRALVLFCAEQGFVGGFNDRIFESLECGERDLILLIGARGISAARERGLTLSWTSPAPSNADTLSRLAHQISEKLYALIANEGVADVDIVHARAASNGAIHIERRSLLPIDYTRFEPPRSTQAPLTNLAPKSLIERLAAEYVFAMLNEAAVLAFEAENEARLLAMASAKSNIEQKLDDLSKRERRLRQEQVTSEILELAAGAAATTQR